MNQGYKSVPTGSKSMQESVLYHKKKKKKMDSFIIYKILVKYCIEKQNCCLTVPKFQSSASNHSSYALAPNKEFKLPKPSLQDRF